MRQYRTALLVIDLQNDFTQPWGSVYREPTGEMMDRVSKSIDKMREKGVLVVIVYSGGPAEARKATGEFRPSRTHRADGVRRCLVEGTPGAEIDERIHIDRERDILWHKHAPSAFFQNDLAERLRAFGVENVLVCGVKTNVCCRATVNDAFSHGFTTFAISDMLATNTPELNAFFIEDMAKYFATAVTSDEVFRLLEEGKL